MSLDESGFIREGIDYSFIRRDYGQALHEAGAEPLFLDSSIDPHVAASLCDGIVISGGQDINPSLYAQEKRTDGSLEPLERTTWERRLINACDERAVPILGICYGQQLLNVHYGGTLYQDIASEHGSALSHGTSSRASMHNVTFVSDGLGFRSGDTAVSASRHHQAVDQLAPGFDVVARADDGIIEAIKGHGHYGIQWHPESDGTASIIYRAFVGVCEEPQSIGFAGLVPEPA